MLSAGDSASVFRRCGATHSRQADAEKAAAARSGGDRNFSPVLLDDLVGDEEPQAGALVALGRKERGEELILRACVHADAVVENVEFQPVFAAPQAEGHFRRPFRLTGLGLFIANKIVEQHGGEISVSSAPGRGSLFRVSLPAVSRAAAPENAGERPGTEHPHSVEAPAAEKVLT